MSESSGLALPLIVHWPYRLKTVIQRIIRGRRLPHNSKWFTNVSGNFAVRAHVASTEKGAAGMAHTMQRLAQRRICLFSFSCPGS